jgi:sterol desaturase/sphingolipid hydroxylase (fatty acid hydroxylase superfamily)
VVNIFLILIGNFIYVFNAQNFLTNYLLHLSKTFIIMTFIAYVQRNKQYITPRSQQYSTTSILIFLLTMFIEAYTYHIILISHNFNDTYTYDLLTFIPISFLFELVYDFIHYWIHRISHTNKFLYTHFHQHHHSKTTVTLMDTYYQHPIDFILSNSIPLLITISVINMSRYQFAMMMTFKTIVEVSGHTGKNINQKSFPQFPWIPAYFDISLCTHDHDIHHRYFNYNFSKRFSIWDKIFGTYRSNNYCENLLYK